MTTNRLTFVIERLKQINKENETKEAYSLGDVLLLDKYEKELKLYGFTESKIKELSPSYYNK